MVLKPRASSTTSSRSWSIPSGFRDRRLKTAAGYDDFSQFSLLDNRSAKVIKPPPACRASGRQMARTTQLIAAALLAVALIGAYVAGQLLPQPIALNITVQSAEALAALNAKALDDFGRGYLVRNNYFADLEYAEVKDEPLPLTLTIGNRNEPLKGVRVDGQPVAIEVMACDWQGGG